MTTRIAPPQCRTFTTAKPLSARVTITSLRNEAATPRVPSRSRIAMTVVPEPRPGTPGVMVMARPNTPMFTGRGSTDYVCGHCSFVIGSGVEMGSIGAKLLLKCSSCGSFNRATPAR